MKEIDEIGDKESREEKGRKNAKQKRKRTKINNHEEFFLSHVTFI